MLSHPMLARLKARDPDGCIDVIAPPWALAVFHRMPEVAEARALPFGHGAIELGARRRYAKALPQYDRAIILPNSLKSALIPWHARIPVRTGYRGEMRYGLINDMRRLDPQGLPLMVETFAALAQPAGEPLARPVPEPRLMVDSAARAATVAKFGLATNTPIAAFAPGAEYGAAKRWPATHFATLSRELLGRGWQVWLFGSGKDAAITAAIQQEAGGACLDLAGKTSLAEAIDLLSLATHVVSNDSGLMHIAAALDRPMSALFGSSSPGFTPPLSANARVISLNLSCSPCFKRDCPLGHTNCLVQLEPARVLASLDLR
ncbi:lipopolysaccharide heptosyltransferase II [Usitatibacter palustris]|uniref:lipopolysaccharide heptosyltransferase II n=1 Tax=Usitatibacter palustris TaxID=2732487 RepID=A0A6M4H7V4_9PROT|nr:ADP-heptose--LPS heptosyltransferase 2 [Usitatibacter palustris]